MRLPSLFRRTPSGRAADREPEEPSFSASRSSAASSSDAASPEATVAALRTRARRRLIGATVLVAVAVVSLPWLFESQPRPLPNDLSIEMPHKDGAAMPPDAQTVERQGSTAPTSASDRREAPSSVATRAPSASGEAAVGAERDASAPRPTPSTASHSSAVPQAPQSPSSPAVVRDAARARALLDGSAAAPASAAAGLRYIVQIGAFAEAGAVTAARAKAERLGLKTYTQVIDAPAGRRTRVRVGPYPTRADADRAVSQLKAAGLVAVVLTL